MALLLSFKPGASLVDSPQGEISLQIADKAAISLGKLSPGLHEVLRVLESTGSTEAGLSQIVLENDGFANLPAFYFCFNKLVRCGSICYTVLMDAQTLATFQPFPTDKEFKIVPRDPNTPCVLSRFAYSRHRDGKTVLESPLCHGRVAIEDWRGGAIAAALCEPLNARDLAERVPDLSVEAAVDFLSLLQAARFLQAEEETNEALMQWEFHDLLFHSRIRMGRQDEVVGKTFRFFGRFEPLPLVKAPPGSSCMPLHRPDMDTLQQHDRPLTHVLEARRSIRQHDTAPICVDRLGEFLYRCAGVRETYRRGDMTLTRRPYPSGGACYSLELYLAVSSCQGLEPGFLPLLPAGTPTQHRLRSRRSRCRFAGAISICICHG